MKKLIQSSICLLLLFVPFTGTIAEASGKTQSDITFIQGDQPKKPIIDTIFSGNKKGILPHTGEQLSLYLLIIGICLLIFIYLGFHFKNKNTRKKEQE
ncbi:hypothetical protein IGL98_003308 [Enterococcus sp. DIV0840]|uniref:LPXTG cell wall anchor domain-containing protein n=1 Tax=Enterococcus TaxID=1350 RepID=UPI001A90B150|nr:MULTISPECIES: LPXTG cell wall anchor domain-containing protein [Enterococcus]MBO0435481.1 LPXTG cell wall anchor domain-containing protein [Enterococcus sp. DIV0849a]MBO0473346.1 LPXTG cell wall anchor domain-containing protein [Enterococcus ureasiticus]